MMVVDANVVLSAMRSSAGASHLILREMLAGKAAFAVSPAIAFEYEDLLKRVGIFGDKPWIKPEDDIYVECALAAGATFIVTHDRHFRHPTVRAFGITVLKPADFLVELTTRREPK